MNWQVSQDGQRMIGHMILRKNIDGEDILGLKIVGGTTLSSARKGAIIEKVKRGSIAEQEGHLRVGKAQTSFFNINRHFLCFAIQPDAHSLLMSFPPHELTFCLLVLVFFVCFFST